MNYQADKKKIVRLKFKMSNNEVKYKVVIFELKTTVQFGVKRYNYILILDYWKISLEVSIKPKKKE